MDAPTRHATGDRRAKRHGRPRRDRRGESWPSSSWPACQHRITNHLASHGYRPTLHAPGRWRLDARNVAFGLIVDDFGAKHENETDALHLIRALDAEYETTTDRSDSECNGILLTWNYDERCMDASVLGYDWLGHLPPNINGCVLAFYASRVNLQSQFSRTKGIRESGWRKQYQSAWSQNSWTLSRTYSSTSETQVSFCSGDALFRLVRGLVG